MARVAPPSARLRRAIRLATAPLAVASERLVAHPRVAEIYPEYLVWMLAVMRGILAVMGTAAQRARALAADDAVAAGIAPYLEQHIEEERGHDAWILEDLQVLGVDVGSAGGLVLPIVIAELIGSQYYWVLHAHPVAILGYLAAAEGDPTSPAAVRRLKDATGLPSAAFRTLFEHAELDGSHGDAIFSVIDAVPLSEEQEQLLMISSMSTTHLMTRALEELIETAGSVL